MEFLRKHGLLAAMLLAGTVALVFLRVFDPSHSSIFPPCPIHYLTGFYCPGCGSLRALHALLHGNLPQAWAMNPLSVVLSPFIGYGLISEVNWHFRGRPLLGIVLPAGSIRLLLTMIVLFGVARNIPVHPVNLLAPRALLVQDQSLR